MMQDAPPTTLTDEQVQRLAKFLVPFAFPHMASALRSATDTILVRWREQTLKTLPELDHLTVEEFEDSIANILAAIADAMEAEDPMVVRSLIDKAPDHGFDRFLQKYDPHDLFTEERILRRVVVVELDAQMDRPATKEEAAALHELLDIMVEFALLSLYRQRVAEAEQSAKHAARNERLASLGTLALGIGHDLRNLLFPLRARFSILLKGSLPAEVRDQLETMNRITNGMKDLSANLQYLAHDPNQGETPNETVDLSAWCPDFQSFLKPAVDGEYKLTCDIPEGLPPVAISRAALSQAIFNLIHNAAEAMSDQPDAHIVLTARARSEGGVRLIVTDNGPGMSPEVRKHCFEPFYSTRVRGATIGTGLGLSLVHVLLTNAGAHIEVHSPLPPELGGRPGNNPGDNSKDSSNNSQLASEAGLLAGEQRGTAFIIELPPVPDGAD